MFLYSECNSSTQTPLCPTPPPEIIGFFPRPNPDPTGFGRFLNSYLCLGVYVGRQIRLSGDERSAAIEMRPRSRLSGRCRRPGPRLLPAPGLTLRTGRQTKIGDST